MSWLKQKLQGAFQGTRKGFFEKMQAITPKYERPDWTNFDFETYSKRFDDYATRYPKVKSCLLTIAGQSVAQGIYTVIPEEYDRALQAKAICDDFNKRVGMYLQTRKTVYRLVKYGTSFSELDWNNVNGLNMRPIPHQEHMKPRYNRGYGTDLIGWDYVVAESSTKIEFALNQVAVFALDPEENEPYGTSLLTGIDYELDAQDQIRKNLLAYLEKQAFASNVLQVGDGQFMPQDSDIENIRSFVKNRKVGEDFVTSYPIDLKIMAAAQVETRMIPETLQFTDDQITDALMSPPISKLYNSTEASATVMSDWTRGCLMSPLQGIISEVIEKQVYQPMLEDLGFTAKLTPELSFDPPDVHSVEDAQYWGTMIDKKIQSPEQACKALGLTYDAAYWIEQERKQQEQFEQQNAFRQGKPSEGKDKVKEYHVFERVK